MLSLSIHSLRNYMIAAESVVYSYYQYKINVGNIYIYIYFQHLFYIDKSMLCSLTRVLQNVITDSNCPLQKFLVSPLRANCCVYKNVCRLIRKGLGTYAWNSLLCIDLTFHDSGLPSISSLRRILVLVQIYWHCETLGDLFSSKSRRNILLILCTTPCVATFTLIFQ